MKEYSSNGERRPNDKDIMLNVLNTEFPDSRDLAQYPYKKFEVKSRSPSTTIITFEYGTHSEHISINRLNLKNLLSFITPYAYIFVSMYKF